MDENVTVVDATTYTDAYETNTEVDREWTRGGPPRQRILSGSQVTILAVLAALIGSSIVVGNSLVIFSILRPKNRDKMATPTNILMSQLSMADFLVGVLTVPSYVLMQKSGWPNNYVGCIFNLIFSLQLPPIVSYFGCLFLCLERYLAIQYPFTWERIVNKRSVLVVVSIIIWVSPIAFLHAIFGYNNGWNRMNVCLFRMVIKIDFTVYVTHFTLRVAPLLAMIFMYVKIFLTARRHLVAVTPGVLPVRQPQAEAKVPIGRQIRTAQKCFVVVAVIALFLIPQTFNSLVNLYAGLENRDAGIATAVLMIMNSAINPFLYARSNAKLKAEVKKLIFFWRDPTNSDINSTTLTSTRLQ